MLDLGPILGQNIIRLGGNEEDVAFLDAEFVYWGIHRFVVNCWLFKLTESDVKSYSLFERKLDLLYAPS